MIYFKSTSKTIYRVDDTLSYWETRWADRYEKFSGQWESSGLTYSLMIKLKNYKKISKKEVFLSLL